MAKSFFFQDFDPREPENKPFLNDLQELAKHHEAVLPPILAKVADYIRAGSTQEKRALVMSLAETSGAPAIQIAYHMRCLQTLFAVFNEHPDEAPENLAADFIEDAELPEVLQPALVEVFRQTRDRAAKETRVIDEMNAVKGVLPLLDDVRSTVELRGVFHGTPPEEHLAGFVGIISIQLALDTNEIVRFQCSRKGAEYLIGELHHALGLLERVEEQEALNSTASAPPHGESQTA
jgi:hypothetical protein